MCDTDICVSIRAYGGRQAASHLSASGCVLTHPKGLVVTEEAALPDEDEEFLQLTIDDDAWYRVLRDRLDDGSCDRMHGVPF